MEKVRSLLSSINERLFANTYQMQRIAIYLGIALVLATLSFGGYYYFDRYYSTETPSGEKALSDAEQAVRDDPQSVDARLDLAESYMFSARWDEAIAQADQVLVAEPDNQGAWLVIGISNANNGKPAEAIEPLTKFVDARKDEDMPGLDRSLHAAAYYLGDSFLQLNQPQQAIEPLEQAVNWSRTDADAMYKLGVAYAAVQENQKALNMFHAATTFVPNFVEAYEAMGSIYKSTGQSGRNDYAQGMVAFAKKDYPTALDLLSKAAQAEPGFAPAFVGLGMTHEAMENYQSAKTNFETAAMLDPNNFTAVNGLERVEALLNK